MEVRYYWHIGQAQIVHDSSLDETTRAVALDRVRFVLEAARPLSRALYKYIGFVATR